MSVLSIIRLSVGVAWLPLVLPAFVGKAQGLSVPNKQSIDKTLSLRVQPRSMTYERPITGSPLKINNGATVLFQDGSIQGVVNADKPISSIKLVPSQPITANIDTKERPIQKPIEMQVLGQCIYLDRLVELLIVQDITGRSIKTLLKGNKMKLDDLRAGVYIVRVQDKGQTHTSKFILR